MYNKFLEYLLENKPEKVISPKGIKIRKILSPIVRRVIVPLSSKNKLNVEQKAILPKNKPIIFASTHGFRDDIAFAIKAVGVHTYILLGSLMVFYYSVEGLGLWLNGTILVDRKNKNSRAAAKEKMCYAINSGTNILMYPEGVWNKTENLIVQKLFPGIYDVAKNTGAIVVPIATIEEKGVVHCILGEPIDICAFERIEALQVLRDKMATYKYELMDKYSHVSRLEIEEDYWGNFLDDLVASARGLYDYEIENTAHYVDKNEATYEDVFGHLNKMIPKRENAFLFDKRIK